ncbi:hypothetical protein AAV98_17185 [Bacillus sp. CHD6a]|nr:hypothetical protein AAV98_17185 [Bacillus sp. CHD6a]
MEGKESCESSAVLIVADESTGNLDEDTAKSIIALLQKLAHEEGKCVIVVTNYQSIASKIVEERMREVVVSELKKYRMMVNNKES